MDFNQGDGREVAAALEDGGTLFERELRRVTRVTGSPQRSALSPQRKPRPMPPPAAQSRAKALANVRCVDQKSSVGPSPVCVPSEIVPISRLGLGTGRGARLTVRPAASATRTGS